MTSLAPELYLIAHKVRGEPAFDIAYKLQIGDEEGWIIPTSGHRAYPYRFWSLNDLYDGSDMDMPKPQDVLDSVEPPEDLPDHYVTCAAPGQGKIKDLFSALGFKRNAVVVNRRI